MCVYVIDLLFGKETNTCCLLTCQSIQNLAVSCKPVWTPVLLPAGAFTRTAAVISCKIHLSELSISDLSANSSTQYTIEELKVKCQRKLEQVKTEGRTHTITT